MSEQIREQPGNATTSSDADSGVCHESPDQNGGVGVFIWKTRARFLGIPLICIACGTDQRGKSVVAKGFVAVGRYAMGGLAIGQFAAGVIGIGQVSVGLVALGQVALSPIVAFGQLAVGVFAVGQFVIGKFGRGQFGWAKYLWSPGRTDMEAVAMFKTIEWLLQQDLSTIWENIKDALNLGL
jgi:hypothetical protein